MQFTTQKTLFVLLIVVAALSCRKETVFNTRNTTLSFSADTVFLDTVFTTIGSSTRLLKVYNPTDENILVNRIYLGRGQNSFFRLNVNGTSTKNIADVELPAKDSIYIFVEVTADVMVANTLLYTDSILFETGNVRQDVDLVTLAQDAYFHYPTNVLTINQPEPFPPLTIPYSIVPCQSTWQADKPHVVYGYVVVDSACSLTIAAGANIHFHSGGGLWVYRGGKLLIDPDNQGDMDNPVLIQGDRLEPAYKDIPGQWGGLLGGIFIQSGSTDNVINNAIIKNATTALRVDSTALPTPNLQLSNVQILNNSRVGIYGGYARIAAQNLIVGNCGLHLFYGLGGNYTFRHCTFANYWASSSRSTTSLALLNFFEDDLGNRYTRALGNAYFGNCIVYGSAANEVALAIDNNETFNYKFNNAILRIDETPDNNAYNINDPNFFSDCIFNINPLFVDAALNNYAPDSLSPVLDIGNFNDANLVPFDIFGNVRSLNPDLGAIERVP